MITFCNYHKHDHLSNLRVSDSVVTAEDYAKRAVELGHSILSSCQHGLQGNAWETIELSKKYNLKPLIAAEAYWVKDRNPELKDRSNCHIFVGAKNENGRRALNDVLSEANLTGFYGQPRLDIPLILSLPKDDVIVTTSCIGYWRYSDSDKITKLFAEHFKHFYLEVQYHNVEDQRKLNKYILKLRDELKVPIIMGCDSHYIYPEQSQIRTNFLLSKGMNYPEEENWFMDYPDGDTAYKRFANQCVLTDSQIREAMDNTNVFTEIEEYDCPIFNEDVKLPSLYPDYTQEQKDEEYKKLVWAGWEEYKKDIPEEMYPTYEKEIKAEIQVVIDTKMADYFIIDYYIMKKGKENGGWLTKSARGSGAAFFTNTLLGFSDIDRIAAPVKLFPSRFMSTTRILAAKTCPDIDMNEAPTEPFVRAQAEILGQDHSYPMIAYGTMQKSAAWKLYAKSQNVPFEIANAVSEQIKKYEKATKHGEDEEENTPPDIKDYIDKEYIELYQKSADYLGLIVSWSIAPCSSLIYQGSIRKEIGLVKVKDSICCLADGHNIERYHMLKNDHLKVSVVDLIYKAYHRIGQEPPKVRKLLEMCPPTDKAWEIYENGCTLGINQCEQDGTTSMVSKYKPKNISELSAFVAAIRPGGASFRKDFIDRKHFSYGIKTYDEILQTKEFPNSYLLYQEQIMQTLNYAGIDMAECYTAIKDIAKKRVEKVIAYKEIFLKGFVKAIIDNEGKSESKAKELADRVWQVINDASSYVFCAGHAYCVALDSLYCAWLKAHHPLEFYEVLLTLSEEKGDKDKMKALKDEAEDYFKINFPPLRFGQDNRSIKCDANTNSITNSIASIKGYSVEVGNILFDCSLQNYTKFTEVLSYLNSKSIKRAKIEPLIKIGYFNRFADENKLLHILEFWDFMKQGEAKIISKEKARQIKLCDRLLNKHCQTTENNYKILDKMHILLEQYEDLIVKNPDISPPTMKEKISWSMQVLGYADVVTNKEEDRKRLLITDVTPMQQNNKETWGYRVGTKSLGTGKIARITIVSKIYDKKKLNAGDIIYATDFYKNKTGYWYLQKYEVEN